MTVNQKVKNDEQFQRVYKDLKSQRVTLTEAVWAMIKLYENGMFTVQECDKAIHLLVKMK